MLNAQCSVYRDFYAAGPGSGGECLYCHVRMAARQVVVICGMWPVGHVALGALE
jgi:hypothetical protein